MGKFYFLAACTRVKSDLFILDHFTRSFTRVEPPLILRIRIYLHLNVRKLFRLTVKLLGHSPVHEDTRILFYHYTYVCSGTFAKVSDFPAVSNITLSSFFRYTLRVVLNTFWPSDCTKVIVYSKLSKKGSQDKLFSKSWRKRSSSISLQR